jgi:alpha-D-ribose 1-methylphosphonate 5-triphosphate synthase subunit PhnH
MMAIDQQALLPAWEDSVHASQAVFRTVLHAMSAPGSLHAMPLELAGPAPLTPAATALMLALADLDTPVWLDHMARNDAVQSYLRFHCGCALTADCGAGTFALVTDAADLDLTRFEQGTMEYPDRSATLFIQVGSLGSGREYILTGPGIRDTATLRVDGLPDDFAQRWRRNAAAFPLGVDVILCCGNRIAALPRTTQVAERT